MDKVLGNEEKAPSAVGDGTVVSTRRESFGNFDSAFSIPENFDLYSPLALAVLPGASHYHVYI